MTNKVRETSADLVYHEIRVDKDVPDDLGELGKLRLIYNGISANAWLTPVGIRPIREPKPNQLGGDTLPDEVRNSIRDRAASANGIMGRRHFELDRQELGKDEMILGVRMGGESNCETTRRATQSARRATSNRKEVRRPQTCFPTETSKKLELTNAVKSPKSDSELPDLCITRIVGPGSYAVVTDKERNEQKQSELVCIGDLRKRVQILDAESARFGSISAMQEAYRTRTKSAPVQKRKPDDVSRSSSTMLEFHTPYKGPMLKPLLYNDDSKKDHNHTGSGNDCGKTCFRACLASDDFFEKTKSRDFTRSARVPIKRVSYRLRPALRMAFLEQLVISKQPRSRELLKQDND